MRRQLGIYSHDLSTKTDCGLREDFSVPFNIAEAARGRTFIAALPYQELSWVSELGDNRNVALSLPNALPVTGRDLLSRCRVALWVAVPRGSMGFSLCCHTAKGLSEEESVKEEPALGSPSAPQIHLPFFIPGYAILIIKGIKNC